MAIVFWEGIKTRGSQEPRLKGDQALLLKTFV